MIKTAAAAAVILACTAILAACSGAAATLSPAGSAAAPVASAAVVSAAPAASAAVGTVSANSASTAELIAALTTAGVPNPDRWAREIEEYRPYDLTDPTLQGLQDELAKYDPDPATLAAILGALQP